MYVEFLWVDSKNIKNNFYIKLITNFWDAWNELTIITINILNSYIYFF